MKAPTPAQLKKLFAAARLASTKAYAPYSKFKVGAAILTQGGKVYTGCNVENASYGLCNCAERTAIFSAVASGEKPLRLACVSVYTPTPNPTAPCGACRQVIFEFGPMTRVISTCKGPGKLDHTIAELLPQAFGPSDLQS
jgi:cytidine deaminase